MIDLERDIFVLITWIISIGVSIRKFQVCYLYIYRTKRFNHDNINIKLIKVILYATNKKETLDSICDN